MPLARRAPEQVTIQPKEPGYPLSPVRRKEENTMKKIVLALALTAGSILAAYAQEQTADPFQKVNGSFATGKWRNGNSWARGKVEVTEKDGKWAVTATPDDPKAEGLIYSPYKVDVQPGDKIQFRVKASGKGKVRPSVWCYPKQEEGQKEKCLRALRPKTTGELTGESQEMDFEVEIPEKLSLKSGEYDIAYVRASVNFCGGTEAVLEQVVVQKIK